MPLLLMAKSSPPCASSSPNVASRSGTKKTKPSDASTGN